MSVRVCAVADILLSPHCIVFAYSPPPAGVGGLVERILVSFEPNDHEPLPLSCIRLRPCMLIEEMLASCDGALPSEYYLVQHLS